MANLLTQRWTDTGNADRLIAQCGPNLRHVGPWGWMAWHGSRWKRDTRGTIVEAAKATVATFREQATQSAAVGLALPKSHDDHQQALALLRFVTVCESAAKMKAMVDLARSDPVVAADVADFDAKPYLLNTKTQTIDLSSGIARAPDRDDLLTTGADVDPEEAPFHATAWESFLREIMPNADTRAYLQRAIGCSLIGEQRDHVIFLAYGTGRNGKGTLFRAIGRAIGAYYAPIPSDMLMEKPYPTHAAQLADLMGKRLVVANEVPRGKKLDEGKVKELSGGDRIKAQFMRENWFDFTPTHTLWICANDRPRVTGTDAGIWRRMRVVPFLQAISKESEDVDLDRKLAADAKYILQWCIDGALAYLRNGLGTCNEVDTATGEYRAEQDLMGLALSEVCDMGTALSCKKTELRTALEVWIDEVGLHHVLSDRALKTDFARRGILDARPDRLGAWVWCGIALKPEWAARATQTPQQQYRRTYHDNQTEE